MGNDTMRPYLVTMNTAVRSIYEVYVYDYKQSYTY